MHSPARLAASLLRQSARPLANACVSAMVAAAPQIVARGLPPTFSDPVEDTRVRLLTLAEALDVERTELFAHQVAWYKVALAYRGVDAAWLPTNLRAIETALAAELPAVCAPAIAAQVAAALAAHTAAPTDLPSELAGPGPLLDLARRFLLAILENRRDDAIGLLLAAHHAGRSIGELHDGVVVPVQREVGRMWLMAEIPIADEHFASQIVRTCIDRLAAVAPRAPRLGRTVLTFAVGGDLHDLPVRLVAERFEAAGFDVWHLGADMPADDLEWALQDRPVDVIALGATLVLHVGAVRTTIERLRRVLRDRCPPILVGGAPFVVAPDLHRELGADGVARDAASAVAWALQRVG